MENNKNTKIALTIVIMLIVTITSVIAAAVMYGMLMESKKDEKEKVNISSNLNTEIEEDVEDDFIENNSETEITEDDSEDIATQNSFKVYQENYKKAFKQFMTKGNSIDIYPDYEMPGVYRIYLDSNNDAYFEFKEDSKLYAKYGKTFKVESEVANIFMCDVGNGGYAEVVFLKLDGTASSVSGFELEQDAVVNCEKIEGIENAVNVINYVYSEYTSDGEIGASGPATVFIDINGNVIE